MDDILKLRMKWNEYQFRVKQFEQHKESELKGRYPELSQSEIDKKLYNAVERKFKKESSVLLRLHMILTSPFRKV